jgi:hypothetical protein
MGTRRPTTILTSALLCAVLCALLAVSLFGSVASGFAGFDPSGEGSGYPRESNGRVTSPPTIRAHALRGATIKVDGHLDDEGWREADAGNGFLQADPNRGVPPTEETVFKVAYDDDAIYFGVACYEHDPSKTSKTLSRRDQIPDSDLVSVYIDPYHDRTTGYNFRVNPLGVKMDQYVYNDGDMDTDWDAVWEARTSSDAGGWYVEMRIPFSSIRFRAAPSMTWGLEVYRWMHGRGEDTAWVIWDRERRGFVSRFGELTGLEGIPAPRQLEIVPYVVARATDPSASGSADRLQDAENFGADLKYGVTSDLTLNATFQPDFGQVEADPAVLNLSPFETQFDEKRPFFIEGSRFFQHPNFNLFYSRRVGTGDPNARIRAAGKLTGKTKSGLSIAALAAATDITGQGQAHNFLKEGRLATQYYVARVGQEFGGGLHRINLMQTAVLRHSDRELVGDELSRNAYTSGVDFELNFHDRDYQVQGAVVGTVLDPARLNSQPLARHDKIYGTGGALNVLKNAGNLRAGLNGRWEGAQLDPNDAGLLFAPDEITTNDFVHFLYNGDGKDGPFLRGEANVNLYRSWFYGSRSAPDPADASRPLWSYRRGHLQGAGFNVNSWWQRRNYWENWFGVWMDFESTSRYETRGGPLFTVPRRYGFWVGTQTDWRKRLSFNTELNWNWSVQGLREGSYNVRCRWTQTHALSHELRLGFSHTHSDAQWVANFENSALGIGGTSYVFAELDSKVLDLRLRTNLLFTRDQSLEVYLQPFLAVGSYGDARELATPDSYDLRPYRAAGFEVANYDFTQVSVNSNVVYRWEYRPGSALFLVWTHSRGTSQARSDFAAHPQDFHNDLQPGELFANEPANTFLAKITWWLPI